MKIGVFVGSFDPVHKGHTNVINYLIENNIVDKVYVIPTGNYWHKQNLTNLETRIEMLKFIETENIVVNEKYSNFPYTYQILNGLRQENYEDEYFLVIGADNAQTLNKWKNYEDIIKNGIIVVGRNNIEVDLDIPNLIYINKGFGNISSTNIRNSVEDNKEILNEDVYNYIKRNELYERR